MLADPGEKFEDWVRVARGLIRDRVHPDSLQWQAEQSGIAVDLFAEAPSAAASGPASATFTVPRTYQETAAQVYCHRDNLRFDLMYRLLWRLQNGEPQLMHFLTDPDVDRFFRMASAVRRDTHKAKAFVRFRKTTIDGVEWYVAWHQPDHYILRLVAPFFLGRFRVMNWSIITPDASVHWDGETLSFKEGLAQNPVSHDALEDVWRTYYASIFNPARLKIKAMKTEMPVRYWKTLPEAGLIPELIAGSEDRVAKMAEPVVSARDFLPEKITLPAMREAAEGCRGCPLYKDATQVVFGKGASHAQMVLVGEQPGDEEDQQGEPFVGPAGKVLDRAFEAAGIDRNSVYLTNAVKHFKHEFRANRRYHKAPNAKEIAACRPWLQQELQVVKPEVLVCLGASAALSVMGKRVTLKDLRGQTIETPHCDQTIVTYHPSAILRQPDSDRRAQAFDDLVADLKMAHEILATTPPK